MAIKKVTQQVMKEDIWHEIGAGGEPAFANSWVNYGAGYATAAYTKDALGFVHIKGLVKNGTTGVSIFTLPAGYRPAGNEVFANMAFEGTEQLQRITVIGTGTVMTTFALNDYVSISGITFKAAA